MPSGTHIAETYAALEALLVTALAPPPDAPGAKVTVRGLTGGDFDAETARLIVAPPAALVVFRNEDLDEKQPHALVYQSVQHFSVIVGAKNLRGTREERVGALELLATVANALAGAKLTLVSSTQKALVSLSRGAVTLGQLDDDGTWYELRCEVFSIAQYGANAA